MEWQTIDTAPRDGTDLLLWREDCGIMMGRWIAPCDFMTDHELEGFEGDTAFEGDWFSADYICGIRISNDGMPTHWMPLPQPPQVC